MNICQWILVFAGIFFVAGLIINQRHKYLCVKTKNNPKVAVTNLVGGEEKPPTILEAFKLINELENKALAGIHESEHPWALHRCTYGKSGVRYPGRDPEPTTSAD